MEELAHDHKNGFLDDMAQQHKIKERADEIMGNCAFAGHADREAMRSMLLDDDEIIDNILEMGWNFEPFQSPDRDVSLADIRHMALSVQVIVNRLNRMGKEIAEAEADD